MPKVIINDEDGLVQKAGSGVEIFTSLSLFDELIGAKKNILSTSMTLTLADSGAILIPTANSAQTFTLPPRATAAGFYVTFIAGSVEEHAIDGGDGHIQGSIVLVDTTTTPNDFSYVQFSNINSIALGANGHVGDRLTFVCDGNNWYITGLLSDQYMPG